jgi:hypothetical protein
LIIPESGTITMYIDVEKIVWWIYYLFI